MKTLQSKLFLAFIPLLLLSLLISVAASTWHSIYMLNKSMGERLIDNLRDAELAIHLAQERLINNARTVAVESALIESIKKSNRQTILRILEQKVTAFGIDKAHVTDAEGVVIANVKKPTQSGYDSSNRNIQKALKGTVSIDMLHADNGISLDVALPVLDKGEVIGVLEFANDINYGFLSRIKKDFNVDTMIVDGTRLQATTLTDENIIHDIFAKLLLPMTTSDKKSVFENIQLGSDHFYLIRKPLLVGNMPSGYLILARSSEHAHWEIRQLLIFQGAFFAGLFLFAVLITRFVAGKLTTPLTALTSMAHEVARGKLSQRVVVSSNDEIAVLADAFNKMSDDLAATTVSRNYMDTVIKSMNDTLIVVSTDGKILQVNHAGCALLGYEERELIGQRVDFILGDALQQKLSEVFKGNDIGQIEATYATRDGQKVPVLFSCSAMRDNDSQFLGVVCTAMDVRERKRAEENQGRLQAQLLQAQKMESVGRLAGGVAHDFNNMLSVILGHAEMGLMKYPLSESEPIDARLRMIQQAALRSTDLVRQLLAFARKQTVSPKVLDLNDTVAGLLKMLRRLIGEEVDFAWKPGAELWLVKMDPSQVDQLLANLCVNARDAIAGVGKITIETENAVFDEAYCQLHAGFIPGEYVMLAVSDDGCGMDKDVLDHLFEPFFTTKELGKGTGLGLATVYGIVKQNDGFINVYSEPGKGSTFKIYLRRHEGTTLESIVMSTEALPKGKGEVVLLVEDETLILKTSQEMLELLGYRVLTAGTPGEALGLADAHIGEIQLLITDVVMPEMNGWDLAKLLKEIKPRLKCLFTSGYTANVIAHRGILDEGVHFLQKPFSIKNLAIKVHEVLKRD